MCLTELCLWATSASISRICTTLAMTVELNTQSRHINSLKLKKAHKLFTNVALM